MFGPAAGSPTLVLREFNRSVDGGMGVQGSSVDSFVRDILPDHSPVKFDATASILQTE